MDVNPWKWRLSKNLDHITHGIPADLRKTDSDGNLYAAPGTDGCDYVHAETFERIPHTTFYTEDVHNVRVAALSGVAEAKESYEKYFNHLIEILPGVHHYSWYDLERKIKTYKTYWQKHWESLYDIEQEDTAENNMFFEKPWSEVTDDEISDMADQLKSEMGGWVFHSRVDFTKPTKHIQVQRTQPDIMMKD